LSKFHSNQKWDSDEFERDFSNQWHCTGGGIERRQSRAVPPGQHGQVEAFDRAMVRKASPAMIARAEVILLAALPCVAVSPAMPLVMSVTPTPSAMPRLALDLVFMTDSSGFEKPLDCECESIESQGYPARRVVKGCFLNNES
jgi:hypothetical protein